MLKRNSERLRKVSQWPARGRAGVAWYRRALPGKGPVERCGDGGAWALHLTMASFSKMLSYNREFDSQVDWHTGRKMLKILLFVKFLIVSMSEGIFGTPNL